MKRPAMGNELGGDRTPRHGPLPSRWAFAKRLAQSCGVAALVVVPSLLGGMAGYHYFENMEWIDAFANASMILSGMGPMKPDLVTRNGKLFAGFYALYSGLVLIAAAGLIFAPIIHRVMHRFHLAGEDAHMADDHSSPGA